MVKKDKINYANKKADSSGGPGAKQGLQITPPFKKQSAI